MMCLAGVGKSTLLRLAIGHETPKQGVAEFGSVNVIANYYEQNQADVLDLEKTVLDTILQVSPQTRPV
jgi:ATP-binding cassette subfamily F protein 3